MDMEAIFQALTAGPVTAKADSLTVSGSTSAADKTATPKKANKKKFAKKTVKPASAATGGGVAGAAGQTRDFQ